MDANVLGAVHGGVILREVDTTAGVAASRYCGRPAVTASFDQMSFLAPVYVGDVLTCKAAVTFAGTTSIEVGVRVEAQSWLTPDEVRHVASAYLVFVPLDEEGQPVEVPELKVSDEVGARWQREGSLRRVSRDNLRKAIREGRAG